MLDKIYNYVTSPMMKRACLLISIKMTCTQAYVRDISFFSFVHSWNLDSNIRDPYLLIYFLLHVVVDKYIIFMLYIFKYSLHAR